MIASILIGLLTAFLEWLFKRWMDAKFPAMPTTALIAAKPAFLAKVNRYFWLGSKRVAKAEQLYDKAVLRYSSPQYVLERTRSADVIAKSLTAGLTLD